MYTQCPFIQESEVTTIISEKMEIVAIGCHNIRMPLTPTHKSIPFTGVILLDCTTLQYMLNTQLFHQFEPNNTSGTQGVPIIRTISSPTAHNSHRTHNAVTMDVMATRCNSECITWTCT